jgi:hypothetical protein
VTQLTIGYGDIAPMGPVKYLALFQGFIGFLFTILILGRFIALLPENPEIPVETGAIKDCGDSKKPI